TVQVAIDPSSSSRDLVQPGHIFPLKAKPGGVLERTGQTEAAVDLARLAGPNPAGVIGEVMNDDGTMARVPDLERYCTRHGLKMITVADLIAYRRRHDRLVERVVSTRPPTAFGEFTPRGPPPPPPSAASPPPACRPPSASSPPSATARWSTTSTTSRWSAATSRASRT